jgi:uridine kinase
VYDMETTEGITILEQQFKSLFERFNQAATTQSQIESCQILFLAGTPHSQNTSRPTMAQLYKISDLVIFGSHIETDCIGLFEASIAHKPCWIRPWDEPHRTIFDEITSGLVVGLIGKEPDKLLDPTDKDGIKQATRHNAAIVRQRNGKQRFIRQLRKILSNTPQTDLQMSAQALTALIENKVGPGEANNIRVICIAGLPGSGKSTLAEALVEECFRRGRHCQTLSTDDFIDDTELITSVVGQQRSVIKVESLINAIEQLKFGKAIVIPRYYHRVAKRGFVLAYTSSWIIVEGLYTLASSGKGIDGGNYEVLRQLSHLNIWVEGPNRSSMERLLYADALRKKSTEWMISRYNIRREEHKEIQAVSIQPDLVVKFGKKWSLLSVEE